MKSTDILEKGQSVVLERVEESDHGWEIRFNGLTCFFYTNKSVVPHVGDTATFYPGGMGSMVRGLVINGEVVFYRTAEEQKIKAEQDNINDKAARKAKFEASRDKADAKYEALPSEFRERIDRFRRGNPEFRWEFEGYEMMVCTDAVKIAHTLGSTVELDRWLKLDYEAQRAVVEGLNEGHSGNTFGVAVYLARVYIQAPRMVIFEHGAMAGLVGCVEYGCTHDILRAKDANISS